VRALLQRVTSASVSVNSDVVGRINSGLVILLGVSRTDGAEDARYLVDKIANLRIFPDEQGHFAVSALDAGAEMLLVSQFTLHANTRRGRRPSFANAAPSGQAEVLFDQVADLFRQKDLSVAKGRFGSYMQVEIVNDGPVTIMIDSAERSHPRSG